MERSSAPCTRATLPLSCCGFRQSVLCLEMSVEIFCHIGWWCTIMQLKAHKGSRN